MNGVIARTGARSKREPRVDCAPDLGDLDGTLDALDRDRADRARFDVALGEPDGLGRGEHGSGLRHLLHARRDVHGLADRGVAHVEAVPADVQHDFAGIEPDANLDRHAVARAGCRRRSAGPGPAC